MKISARGHGLPWRGAKRAVGRLTLLGGGLFATVTTATTVATVMLAFPTDARAQTDEQRAAARTAATEAVQAFKEGRYADAVDLCKRAESLMHAPTHLLLLGRAQAKLGHLVEAQEAYLKLRGEDLPADAPGPFVRAQEAAEAELRALKPRIPKIKITVEGAQTSDVILSIDGMTASSAFVGLAVPIDPGPHTILGKTTAVHADPVTVNVPEGSTEAVTLRFPLAPAKPAVPPPEPASSAAAPPDPPAQPPRPPPAPDHDPVAAPLPASTETREGRGGPPVGAWISLGIGAAGLLGAGSMLLLNNIDRKNANNDCNGPNGGCPQSKQSDIQSLDSTANTAAVLSWVGLGVGVVGVGTGVVLLATHGSNGPPDAPVARAVRVSPWLGHGGGGLALSGRFE